MKIKVPVPALQTKPVAPGGKPKSTAILDNPLLRSIAMGLATVLIIILVLNAGVIGSQKIVESKELETKAASLQAQVDALQVEKTKVEENLLQVTLEKEQLKTDREKAAAQAQKDAADLRASLVANATALKQILSTKDYDPIVLDQARQNYVQWELYACQYYLGVYVFTSGGNVTVPIGCVLFNAAYVNSSIFLINQVANSTGSPSSKAIEELNKQYPELQN